MSSVPMPRDLSEEAVESAFTKRWCSMAHLPSENVGDAARWFRAGATYFRALLREKVREAVVRTNADARDGKWIIADEIVSRVMGDHPSNASGGHDEGRPARGEAPRG